MKSRDVVRLFFSTLVVGGISTVCVSFIERWGEYSELLLRGEIRQIFSLLLWFICVGFMFSLVSQMGFFAYLTVHRMGISIFRTIRMWNVVQIILILVAVGDFLFFQSILDVLQTRLEQLSVIVGLVFIAIVVAYIKVGQTNRSAFIPSMFFMIVVTLVEWIPAISADDNGSWLYHMLIPLLICNGYQLLMLYSLQQKSYLIAS